MNASSLQLIPWQINFLPALMHFIQKEHPKGFNSTVCIFPHQRASQYVTNYLATSSSIKRPLVMPATLSASTFTEKIYNSLHPRPLRLVQTLDRVGLLYTCVQKEQTSSTPALFHLEANLFFPWGIRLDAFFEDCFTHMCEPENFAHLEYEAPPFAALLLARLSSIFNRYKEALAQKLWTTPALIAYTVAEHIQKGSLTLPAPYKNKYFYLAGFAHLTGTENKIFHHLWQEYNAQIILHADPRILHKQNHHWSCDTFIDWAKSWKTTISLVPEIGLLQGFSEDIAENFQQKGVQENQKRTHKTLQENTTAQPSLSFQSEQAGPTRPSFPQITFYEGYDLHSQLQALQKELVEWQEESEQEKTKQKKTFGKQTDNTANKDFFQNSHNTGDSVLSNSSSSDSTYSAPMGIILPQSGLLMPCLHHLPRMQCNISMGYPLHHSPIFQLLDTLFTLQENRRDTSYYWRDITKLVRHPYLKMLSPAVFFENMTKNTPSKQTANTTNKDSTKKAPATPENTSTLANARVPEKSNTSEDTSTAEQTPLRTELQRLERSIRSSGLIYIEPWQLMRNTYQELALQDRPEEPLVRLLEKTLTTTLNNIQNVTCLYELGAALQNLCTLLFEHGQDLWRRFPIDAECLHRLLQSLIPELMQCSLAHEPFSQATLFSLIRQLVKQERVPFTASPLVGLQVLGMLESRLLSIEHVCILDATETNLPGVSEGDPLVPEPLRTEIGLPSTTSRAKVNAYHFFRLLAGAKKVSLFWQEGTDASLEQKKQKSRFIEELLWLEEKQQGYLVDAPESTIPFIRLGTSLTSQKIAQKHIQVTKEIRALIEKRLRQGISASFLESYLRCPVQFFHERIANLKEPDTVVEKDDPLAIGNLLHTTLEEFYTPLLGKHLAWSDEEKQNQSLLLQETFMTCLTSTNLNQTLPADSYAMLKQAAQLRLQNYLANQPPTTPLAVEQFLSIPFLVDGNEYVLKGKIDRIDSRPIDTNKETLIILDYKTGKIPYFSASLLSNTTFWQEVAKWSPTTSNEVTQGIFAQLSNKQKKSSIQLPFYLQLLYLAQKQSLPWLTKNNKNPAHWDAAFISLGAQGKEHIFFPPALDSKERELFVTQDFTHLVRFLIRHMQHTSAFKPHQGTHCDWCFCKNACMISTKPSICSL